VGLPITPPQADTSIMGYIAADMSRHSLTVLVILTFVLAMGAIEPVGAGQQTPSTFGSKIRRELGRAPGTSANSVVAGQVLTADHRPLPFARVRLRNLDRRAVVERTSTNHRGEFSFLVSDRGSYVVELLDQKDRVVAVGLVLTVEAGETVGTLVLLPAYPLSFADLFGNSAGAIMSAAAGAGITAVSTTGAPVSPEK